MHRIYEHLSLVRWPFPVVPQQDFCTFIADRKQLRADVEELLVHLSRRDTSSIHLFWAWFGAGKTHTLFYLMNQAVTRSGSGSAGALHCVYTEFPKAPRGFVDLYHTFAGGLDPDVLINSYLEIYTAPGARGFHRRLMQESPDLDAALQVLATGKQADYSTAMRWLRAVNLPASEYRAIGISNKLTSLEDAGNVLANLQRLYCMAAECQHKPGCRLIWIVDEYQRIERLSKRVREEINTALHSIFNSCPTGLSILLSFSGKPQAGPTPPWLTPELASRIGRTKVMVLPPLQPQEALVFVREILCQFRMPGKSKVSEYFPFSKEACETIIKEVNKTGELKPREIMSAFNAVLQEADPMIEAGRITEISAAFAQESLSHYADVDVAYGDEG